MRIGEVCCGVGGGDGVAVKAGEDDEGNISSRFEIMVSITLLRFPASLNFYFCVVCKKERERERD